MVRHKPVTHPPKGPKTTKSAVTDTQRSARTGRRGEFVNKQVQHFGLVQDAKELENQFRDYVLSDYQGRCQICGTSFLTRKGNDHLQTFVTHIVPPANDHRTNHFGNMLGLCGLHYAMISYGQWSLFDPDTRESIARPEELRDLISTLNKQVDDDGNSYMAMPVRFHNIYRRWEHNPKQIDEIIRFSEPHWEYLRQLFAGEDEHPSG